MKKILAALVLTASLLLGGCSIVKYSFSGTSIDPRVEMDGDLELSGAVTGYEVRAAAVTANEVAAMNRLTVTASLKFTNRKFPEEDFEQSFSAYSDYDSNNSLDAVEASLCEEIVQKLIEDMFNASVAQW